MKNAIALFLLLLTSMTLSGQSRIAGEVYATNGATIPGVNIYIQGSLDGTTSDINGKFSFTTKTTGPQILIASMVGMESFTTSIVLTGSSLNLTIQLKESINELNAVVITSGSFETGDVNKTSVLNSIDIVTTAGATADIYGALRTLPGVMPSMEESGLFVRGGDASESKTFFDGILVNKPFGSDLPDISQRGRFSPFLFKGTSFSTGAYSAQHGGALSSTMNMESKDLVPKTKSEIGIMSVGVSANHAQKFKNSSLELDGSYYNLKPIFQLVKQNTDWVHEPESWEGNAFYKLKTGETGLFKLYGSYGQSHIGLVTYNREDFSKNTSYDTKSNHLYLNSTWSQFVGKQTKVFAGAGYSDDLNNIKIDTSVARQTDKSFHGRVMMTRYYGKLSDLKIGLDYFQLNTLESYNERSHDFDNPTIAGFIESNIYLSNAVAIRPGLRYEISKYNGSKNLAPQISVAYKVNDASQFSAGYGMYYQLPDISYLYENNNLLFESAEHFVLNYQYQKEKRTFRAEAYYKLYDNLVKEQPEASNHGDGYSRGIDLFYRDTKTIKRAEFWFTYSLLDTKRNYKDFPSAATPSFTSMHVANVVGKYFISKWSTSIGATYTFASGRTYVNPASVDYLSDKTKPYNNFSINISYLTHLGKQFTIVYLSVENIFGIENIYGYRYSPDGLTRKPIIPSATRTIFLGVFITFGDDNPLNI